VTAATAGVTRRAAAKLNLYLRVVDKRRDGYHLLDSLVAFAAIGDVVRAEPAERITLTIDGPFADALMRAGPAGDNLVLRAARGLQSLAGTDAGARLTLTKNLPVASGIGGGSTDAAATLEALLALWDVRPDTKALDALALSLGADVPVCRAARPCRMQGIGEQLTFLEALPAAPLVLVNPGTPLATKAVFGARTAAFSPALDDVPPLRDTAALARLIATGGNDLEAPARALMPAVGSVLDALRASPGCLVAAMSGSGATCFALFDGDAAAAAAETQLRAQPSWWTAATRLQGTA
jgi:4-diphosphocytidyl-2-C-methyl-D-erythritol kinase